MGMIMEKAWLQKRLVIPTLIFAVLYGYRKFSKLKNDHKQVIRVYKTTKPLVHRLKEEKDGEGVLDWTHLPHEIVELILLKSPILDYPRLRATCSTWRTIVDSVIADKYYFPDPQFPYILLNSEKSNKVLSLNQERVYTMRGCKCVGSVEGWLVLTCLLFDSYLCIFFLNPVSGHKIMLPPSTTIPLPSNSASYFFVQVVASCTPDSPECVVAARVYDTKGFKLVFCRIRDESWSLIEVGNAKNYWRIAIHGNKLYAMNPLVAHYVMTFDLSDANTVTAQKLVMRNPKPHRRSGNIASCNGYIFKFDSETYSIVIDPVVGEVFVVFLRMDGYFVRRRLAFPCSKVKGFRVFKLDLNRRRWIAVDDLGDRLLFIDPYGGKVISARALNNNASLRHLVRPNSVYFARPYVVDPERQIYEQDIGCFCLTDKSINRFPQNNWDLSSRFLTVSLWFTPTLG